MAVGFAPSLAQGIALSDLFDTVSGATLLATGGRSGRAAIQLPKTGGHVGRSHTGVGTAHHGGWVDVPGAPGANGLPLLYAVNGATPLLSVRAVAAGAGVTGYTLETRLGVAAGATLVASDATVRAYGRTYFELKTTASLTVGAAAVWVNGAAVAALTSGSLAMAAATVTGVFWGTGGVNPQLSADYRVGDIYMTYSSGSLNNANLGVVKNLCLGVTGDGDAQASAIAGTSPAATRWEGVDDPTPDDDVTGNAFATSGVQQDVYVLADLPAEVTGAVKAALITARWKSSSGSATTTTVGLTKPVGGAVVTAAASAATPRANNLASTAYGVSVYSLNSDPTSAGTALLASLVNSLQWGWGRNSASVATLTLTQLTVDVCCPETAPATTEMPGPNVGGGGGGGGGGPARPGGPIGVVKRRLRNKGDFLLLLGGNVAVTEYQEVKILNGASQSSAPIDKVNFTLMTLEIPTGFQGTSVSFLAAEKPTDTPLPVYDDEGNEAVATVAAGRAVSINKWATVLASARYLWIRSGTAAAPQVQSADRVVGVYLS